MTLNLIWLRQTSILFILSLLVLFPAQAHALIATDIPSLDAFIEQVSNGEPGELRGVYVPGVFADMVTPQPDNNPAYVSSRKDALTDFEMASRYGSTGLLAHNYFAGRDFFLLERGQTVYLIYGDGRVEAYIVKYFMRYQALDPYSVTSEFVDLETGELLTASKLFLKIYNRPGDVVLQTCIYAQGNSSWGRLFIIAERYGGIDEKSMSKNAAFD